MSIVLHNILRTARQPPVRILIADTRALLHAQIIEGRQGGITGPDIGHTLNRDADAKLPLEGEDDETDPAKVHLNKLVRECGLLDRGSRPNITAILVEAKSIYDSPGVLQVGTAAKYTLLHNPAFCRQA